MSTGLSLPRITCVPEMQRMTTVSKPKRRARPRRAEPVQPTPALQPKPDRGRLTELSLT